PGWAGFWVARTFPTSALGTVHVPANVEADGFAAACALVARLRHPYRPVVVAVDAPVHDRVREVVDIAAGLGIALGVEVWSAEGEHLDALAHADRLVALATAEHATFATLAT